MFQIPNPTRFMGINKTDAYGKNFDSKKLGNEMAQLNKEYVEKMQKTLRGDPVYPIPYLTDMRGGSLGSSSLNPLMETGGLTTSNKPQNVMDRKTTRKRVVVSEKEPSKTFKGKASSGFQALERSDDKDDDKDDDKEGKGRRGKKGGFMPSYDMVQKTHMGKGKKGGFMPSYDMVQKTHMGKGKKGKGFLRPPHSEFIYEPFNNPELVGRTQQRHLWYGRGKNKDEDEMEGGFLPLLLGSLAGSVIPKLFGGKKLSPKDKKLIKEDEMKGGFLPLLLGMAGSALLPKLFGGGKLTPKEKKIVEEDEMSGGFLGLLGSLLGFGKKLNNKEREMVGGKIIENLKGGFLGKAIWGAIQQGLERGRGMLNKMGGGKKEDMKGGFIELIFPMLGTVMKRTAQGVLKSGLEYAKNKAHEVKDIIVDNVKKNVMDKVGKIQNVLTSGSGKNQKRGGGANKWLSFLKKKGLNPRTMPRRNTKEYDNLMKEYKNE